MENVEKKKERRSNMPVIVIGILLLAGVGFLLFKRLTTVKKVDLSAIPSVNVTHIRRGSIDKEISVMGNILPTDTYYVPAKVGGDIKKIYVENGDRVKKGDPICEIDASKEIEAAYIQYNTARKSYDRMRKLYNAGDISLQNFESVKAQYDAAKLQYDTKVEYSIPVAVGDGVVENTNMTINTSIKVETVLCYITSEEGKEINFGVTERVLSGINIGDKVTIEKSGKKYDGYISNIANLVNTSNGLFDVKATITSPNDFASGVMAKVTFVYDRRKNISVLPNELIYYEGGNAYIYVVNEDNTIAKKYIDIGVEDEKTSEVLTELDKSLRIVSTWNNSLAEGTLVNVVKDEEVYDEVDFKNDVEKELTDTAVKEETNKKIEETTVKVEETTTTDNVNAPTDTAVREETTKKVEETTKKVEETKKKSSKPKKKSNNTTNNNPKIVPETTISLNEIVPIIVPEENSNIVTRGQLPSNVKITEVK